LQKHTVTKYFTLICCYFCIPAAQIVMDCCLSVSEKRLIPKNIVSYKLQVAGSGCDISATVFMNKKGMKLCVVPPEGNQWIFSREARPKIYWKDFVFLYCSLQSCS
uniref:Chemokine interleukin-8-like domain-containing protein n=1 Tax=Xiphophorus couchianus TaxID=32473 RepID=A0A3B5LTL4_9TELE